MIALQQTQPTIARFKTGETYYARSFCDYDCVWTFRIVRRTEKSVWLQETNDGNDVRESFRKRIRLYQNEEQCEPLGRYSMSPILGAEKTIGTLKR